MWTTKTTSGKWYNLGGHDAGDEINAMIGGTFGTTPAPAAPTPENTNVVPYAQGQAPQDAVNRQAGNEEINKVLQNLSATPAPKNNTTAKKLPIATKEEIALICLGALGITGIIYIIVKLTNHQ